MGVVPPSKNSASLRFYARDKIVQRAGRADIDALPAVDADCRVQTAVFGGADDRMITAVDGGDRTDRLDIVADAHAASAENTAVRVSLD